MFVKYLLWILRILVFVILMGFALKNTDPVVVHFYLGTQWEAPVVFVLLVAFVLGATGGVLASLGVIFRRRREVAALRKQLRAIDSGNPG